jgi:uncharacterized protein (DUF427 family)
MPKATWKNTVIADSDRFEQVEGYVYFPPESIDCAYFRESTKTTTCPWKGTARYYDIVVDGEVNPAAAWTYPEPKPAAAAIRNYIAFWQGGVVEP